MTQIKNRDSLVKALQRAGYKADQIETHDKAQTLYGYKGDKRPEKANVIVRRKYVGGAANDIGFELQSDGTYKAIISDYDRLRHNDAWMAKVTQGYGVEQAKSAFEIEGWNVTESTNNKGEIQLVGVNW